MTDEGSRAIMNKTIQFFESMGKTQILDDYNKKAWYKDYVTFIGKERIFAKLLTPKEYGGSDPDCCWDTARNNEFSELLAFYGLGYQYCFQVSILGLAPIWMSKNEKAKQKAAKLLQEGAIFAFGLSEREHGADIYSTATTLTPKGDGTWVANGEKYYIGNGNEAEMVSTLGKIKDGTDDYTFFVTNYRNKAYELKKNILSRQEYIANFALHDYSHHRGRHSIARPLCLGFSTQYDQYRQIQYRALLDRDCRTQLLRSHYPCRQSYPLRYSCYRHASCP